MRINKSYVPLVMLVAANSYAGVTDHFNCKIEVKALDGKKKTLSASEFDVARRDLPSLVESSKPADPTRGYTLGSANLIAFYGEKSSVTASLSYYTAVVKDLYGRPTQAKQFACLSVAALDGGKGIQIGCPNFTPDPFGFDADGWDAVELSNGIPVFDPQGLRPVSVTSPDGNTVTAACQYVYTLN